MNFCKKLKNYFIRVLIPEFNNKKNVNGFYANSTTKRSMNGCCTLEFSSETNKINEEVKAEVKETVKKYFNTPEKLVQFIRTKGADVYRIKNAEKLLSKIGEEEGFITPLKGLKALYLNFIINGKLGLSTKELFVFDVNNTEIYTIARAYYKYAAYKKNMPGYDYASQEIFKKLYNKRHHSSPFNNCNIEEIYACKEALNRDMESINFTLEISVEYENSKRAADKLVTESSISV